MEGRDGININVFGMSGIPQDVLDARREEMGIPDEPPPIPPPGPVIPVAPTPVAVEAEAEALDQQAPKPAKPKTGAMDTMNKVLEVATSNSEQDGITKALLAAAATNAPSSAGDTARIIAAVLKATTASKTELLPAARPSISALAAVAASQSEADPPAPPPAPRTEQPAAAFSVDGGQASASASGMTGMVTPAAAEPDPYEEKTLEEFESSLALVPVGSEKANGDSAPLAPGSKIRLKDLKFHYRLNGAVGSVLTEKGKLPDTVKVLLETGHDFTVRLTNLEICTGESSGTTVVLRSRSRGKRGRSRSARRKNRWDPEEKPEDKVDPSLQKPSMCMPFTEGLCKKGSECPFAHNLRELQPGGFKPRLCPSYGQGECPRGKVCVFAHDAKELPPNFKTVVCASFKQGLCRKHGICTFAHGDDELKFFQDLMGTTVQAQPAAVGLVTPLGATPAVTSGTLNLANVLSGSRPGLAPLALKPFRPLAFPSLAGTAPALGTIGTTPTVGTLGAVGGLGAGTIAGLRGPLVTPRLPALGAPSVSVGTMPGVRPATIPGLLALRPPNFQGLTPAAKAGALSGSAPKVVGAVQPKALNILPGTPGLSLRPGLLNMGGVGGKKKCTAWEMGGCPMGASCPFAHGV